MFLSLKSACILADSADPDEMPPLPPYAAFHLDLEPVYRYQNEKGKRLHYLFFKINSNESL